MGFDSCKSSDKLEKLFILLGINICWKCKGVGRIEEVSCSCCSSEITTCPECDGNEFIIEDDSILKSLIDNRNNEEEDSSIGLCD